MAASVRQLRVGAACIAVATALLAGVLVFTAGPAKANRFATLRLFPGGQVLVQPDAESGFRLGEDEQELREGDLVQTDPAARAEIEFFDGSVTRLDHSTTLDLTELTVLQNTAHSKIIRVAQPRGVTFTRAAESTDPLSIFEVTTPTVTARVDGSVYLLAVDSSGRTTAKVIEGTVTLASSEGSVTVGSGEKVAAASDGTIGPITPLLEADLQTDFVQFNECTDATGENCPAENPGEVILPEEPAEETPAPVPVPAPEPEPTSTAIVPVETILPPPPPSTIITDGPSGPLSVPSATFEFTSPDGASSFECALDEDPFSSCSSGVTYGQLSEGNHAFQVRAVDQLGGVDPDPPSRAFTVDTKAPEAPTISSHPGDPTSEVSATLGYRANADQSGTPEHFQCALDGSDFQLCPSSVTFGGLSEGNHAFRVRNADAAGNKSGATEFSWAVDLTPPDTVITEGPPVALGSSDATFQFASPDDPTANFECAVDGGGFSGCSSPHTYSGLADGTHTVDARAVDRAGNEDPTPASVTFTVDTIAPEPPVITGHPPESTADTVADFGFEATSSGTGTAEHFECSLDGSPYAACISPASYAGLADGEHTFSVQAVDASGNRSAAAVFVWTVESVPLDTTITSGPPAEINSPATFEFESPIPGSTFECSLDASSFSACTSPMHYPDLADGPHTFLVRTVDSQGNADPTPASWAFTVVTVPPPPPPTESPPTEPPPTETPPTEPPPTEEPPPAEDEDEEGSGGDGDRRSVQIVVGVPAILLILRRRYR